MATASETLIGRFLGGKTREQLFIAPSSAGGDPGWPKNFSREVVRKATRFVPAGVEALDLPSSLACRGIGERVGWLEEVTRRKKSRVWRECRSHERGAVAARSLVARRFRSFQYFPAETHSRLFDTARRNGVALIVRLPLASGCSAGA